ncbi:hypothetical protein DWX17_09215 [[Clostridium] innocuum]|nr:hypothetical protein DWX17_09215 [[Clostridium] innocuum]
MLQNTLNANYEASVLRAWADEMSLANQQETSWSMMRQRTHVGRHKKGAVIDIKAGKDLILMRKPVRYIGCPGGITKRKSGKESYADLPA